MAGPNFQCNSDALTLGFIQNVFAGTPIICAQEFDCLAQALLKLNSITPSSGVTAVGAINTQTPSSNGAVIQTGSIFFQTATGSRLGMLTSTDWNTFNNKPNLSSFSTVPPLNYSNTTGVFSMSVANASNDGYLAQSDYVIFGSKASLTSFSATTPLTYNNTTGAFNIQAGGATQGGYITQADWNTFNNKPNLVSLSATSPLLYNSTTGVFTIQNATAGQTGAITSTDWNTFNNKLSLSGGTMSGSINMGAQAISNVSSISLSSSAVGLTLTQSAGGTPALINFVGQSANDATIHPVTTGVLSAWTNNAYYGASSTHFLGTPTNWLRVKLGGVDAYIPTYA